MVRQFLRRAIALSFHLLPKQSVEDDSDNGDTDSAIRVATCSAEEAEVDGQSLRVGLLVLRVAVEPNCVAAYKNAEEDECLEADIVKVSGNFCRFTHEHNHDAGDDEEYAESTENVGPRQHCLHVFLFGQVNANVLAVISFLLRANAGNNTQSDAFAL